MASRTSASVGHGCSITQANTHGSCRRLLSWIWEEAKRARMLSLLNVAALLGFLLSGCPDSVNCLELVTRPPRFSTYLGLNVYEGDDAGGLVSVSGFPSSAEKELSAWPTGRNGLLETVTERSRFSAGGVGREYPFSFVSAPFLPGSNNQRLESGGVARRLAEDDPNRTGARPKVPGVDWLMQRLSIRRGGRRDSPSRQGEEPTASLPGLPGDEGGLQQPPARQGETAEGSEDPAGSSSSRKTKKKPARASSSGQESSADSSGRSSVLLTMPAAWHRFRRRRHRSPPSTQEVEVPSPEPFRPSGPGFTIPTNEAVERFLLEQRAGPDVFGSSPPSSVLISPCRDCELREQLAASLQRDEELRRQAEATALALEADLEMEMARLEGLSASARSHLHDRLLTHTRAQLWSTRHTLKEAKQKKGVHTEKRHQLDGHAVERRKAESKLAETLRSRLRREQRERSEHSAAWVDGTRQQLLAAGISSTPPASGRSSPSMVGAAAPSSRQEDPRRDDDVHTRLRALNVLADTTVRRNRGPS